MPEMPDFDEIMKMAQNAQAELQKMQSGLPLPPGFKLPF